MTRPILHNPPRRDLVRLIPCFSGSLGVAWLHKTDGDGTLQDPPLHSVRATDRLLVNRNYDEAFSLLVEVCIVNHHPIQPPCPRILSG